MARIATLQLFSRWVYTLTTKYIVCTYPLARTSPEKSMTGLNLPRRFFEDSHVCHLHPALPHHLIFIFFVPLSTYYTSGYLYIHVL